MTTLEELTQPRCEDVETPAGLVSIRSVSFSRVAEMMDLPPAESAPALIAASVVSPAMTKSEAEELPADITLILAAACMRVNGLDAESD